MIPFGVETSPATARRILTKREEDHDRGIERPV
jgi:hypothetical protein